MTGKGKTIISATYTNIPTLEMLTLEWIHFIARVSSAPVKDLTYQPACV